jgi:hypothetical protein
MSRKNYRVQLTRDEKKRLEDTLNKGTRQVRRARALLLLNEGGEKPVMDQRDIAERCGFGLALWRRVSASYPAGTRRRRYIWANPRRFPFFPPTGDSPGTVCRV